MANEAELVEVFTGDPLQAAVVHSFLEAEGFLAFLADQYMGLYEQWVPSVAARVLVPRDQVERARAVLASRDPAE